MRKKQGAGEIKSEAGQPLHLQVREAIREKIESGELGPGDLVPGEIELAVAFSVSRSTVRRALQDLAQEGFLQRVPGRGTHVQRRRPQVLKVVALVCPFLRWYMTDVIDGIERIVKTQGYELVIRNSKGQLEAEAQQITELVEMGVSGIVLWPKTPDFSLAPSTAVINLLSGKVPTVVIDQHSDLSDSVTTDHYGGGYLIGQHLYARGYRRIGFITYHKVPSGSVQSRWDGLQEMLNNEGVPTNTGLLFKEWGNQTAFEAWLAQESPDALFCANDSIALEVLSTLNRCGWRVPEQLAVVGYDDIPVASHPPLTTVKQDFRAVGQSAGRLLLRRIATPNTPVRHVVIPVDLQIRSSCGFKVTETTLAG